MQNGNEPEKDTDNSKSHQQDQQNGNLVTVAEMHGANDAESKSKREAGDGSETAKSSSSRRASSDPNSIEMKNMAASPDDIDLSHLATGDNDDDDDEGNSPAEKLSNSSDFEIVQKESEDTGPHNAQVEERRNLIS